MKTKTVWITVISENYTVLQLLRKCTKMHTKDGRGFPYPGNKGKLCQRGKGSQKELDARYSHLHTLDIQMFQRPRDALYVSVLHSFTIKLPDRENKPQKKE